MQTEPGDYLDVPQRAMKERIKGDLAQPEPDDRLRDIIRKKKEETYRNNIFVFRLAPSSNFDQRQQTRRKTPPLRGLISTNEMDTPRSRKTARNCEDKSSFIFIFFLQLYGGNARLGKGALQMSWQLQNSISFLLLFSSRTDGGDVSSPLDVAEPKLGFHLERRPRYMRRKS